MQIYGNTPLNASYTQQEPYDTQEIDMLRSLVFCFLFANITGTVHAVDFTVDTDILVRTADSSPDGNGVFSNEMLYPVLNDAGQAVVWAKLLATSDPTPVDDWGFFRADRNTITAVIRGGDLSAYANPLRMDPGAISSNLPILSRPYAIDSQGRVTVAAPDSSGQPAVYRADGLSLEPLLVEGAVTAFGTLTSFNGATLQANDAGQFTTIALSSVVGQVLVRSDETGHTALFSPNQALPDGRVVSSIAFASQSVGFNNNGSAAGVLTTVGNGFQLGVYTSDGVAAAKILHTGEPAPDGLGSFVAGELSLPQQNDSGQVLSLFDVDDVVLDYRGLFLGEGTQLNEVARVGDVLADGILGSFSGDIRVNNQDTLVFGVFAGTPVGPARRLMMRRNGQSFPVITAGDQLPDPIGLEVRDPFTFALNNQDQVMISALVIAEGVSRQALFLYDPDKGLALVARAGMPFQGDILDSLEVALPFYPNNMRSSHNAQNSFNNLGEVVFKYSLQNGQAGIALASVEFLPDLPDVLFRDGFETLR